MLEKEFYYSALDVALILFECDLTCKEERHIIKEIFWHENSLLLEEYETETCFFLEVESAMDFLMDTVDIASLELIERDLNDIDGDFEIPCYNGIENIGPEFFFKRARLRVYVLGKRPVRIKLRNLLKLYGAKRRSRRIITHMQMCMEVYCLRPYISGGRLCDISTVPVDRMVMFYPENMIDISL